MVSMEGGRDEQLVFTQSLLHDRGDRKKTDKVQNRVLAQEGADRAWRTAQGKLSQAERLGRSQVCTI